MSTTCISRLEDLALQRVFEDIFRYATKFRDDPSKYSKFQGIFADNIVQMIKIKLDSVLKRRHLENENYVRSLQQFSDFIFNPSVKRLKLPLTGYSPEIIGAITRGCKNLEVFCSRGRSSLDPAIYNPLFRSVKQLTVLGIEMCGFLDMKTVEVIASSLSELKSLSLFCSNINDEALFTFCGHRRVDAAAATDDDDDDDDAIPRCSFTKDCEMNSPLKLINLDIVGTHVSKYGVACVLTHIPTLRVLRTSIELPETLSEIDLQRKKCGMPQLKTQITSLWISDGNWDAVLGSCPALQDLHLAIRNDNSRSDEKRDEALATCKLTDLRCIYLLCESTDHVTESLNMFWESKGQQIRSLTLRGRVGGRMLLNAKDLKYMLTMCPFLEELTIVYTTFHSPLGSETLKHIPGLRNLKKLDIHMNGEPRSTVVTEVFSIICEATEITDLTLAIPAEIEIEDFLSEVDFPFLTNVTYRDYSQARRNSME